jgi:hypothetical protein
MEKIGIGKKDRYRYRKIGKKSDRSVTCGILLEIFGYAVKIQSEGIYTLTESDIHHFFEKQMEAKQEGRFPGFISYEEWHSETTVN